MDVPTPAGATPAIAQWIAVKTQHPDALVFFRMGDFYELFFGDAEAASVALGIAMSHRGEHNGVPIAMCGVPIHAAEPYLARLIRRGFRVAIAEQMEDPRQRAKGVKGPLRREVVRLITPGTLTEDSLLDAARPNLLLSLTVAREEIGAAWLDVSTGLFETEHTAAPNLLSLLSRLDPAEILAPAGLPLGDWENRRGPDSPTPPPLAARHRLAEAYGAASLDALGDFTDAEAMAAARVLNYVRMTQAGALPRLSRPLPVGDLNRLQLDAATRASLEVSRARDGGAEHTLLSAVQRTVTAGGARLLLQWLGAPLTDVGAITDRQDGWSWLLANTTAIPVVQVALRGAPDISRALGRVALQRGTPRDLAAIASGLAAAGRAAAALSGPLPRILEDAREKLLPEQTLFETLSAALLDPAPARLDDEPCIAPGYDGELDAERRLSANGRQLLPALQLDWAQRYGVAALKIRHHAQLGYVLEVPAAAVDRLRAFPELTLRQGMANGARFTSAELSELDQRIATAGERASARQRVVFHSLVAAAMGQVDALTACAGALALVDVLLSAASLAGGGAWCRPVVTETTEFVVKAGRHPVVEAALSGTSRFVANDCDLSPERRILLLTGPNMAGKSTFLRQNALAVILAQAGLPVAAASARIGVVDRLFSRVGAADDLARGRSTFMVEMTETAAILNGGGPRSLVVVDEIGRGTATLDGLAIAWAVLEALHNQLRCRTIFATHFHELAQLSNELPTLSPHAMRVKEWKGDVIFLHEIADGAAGRSWGVHVARLAGIPASTVRRAAALLATLEKRGSILTDGATLPLFAQPSSENTVAPVADETATLVEALRASDPDRLSPRQALELLYRLKSLIPGQLRNEGLPSTSC